MTASTRKAMGKQWKLGDARLGPEYEAFYLEFKKEIDSELAPPKAPKAEK